MKAFLGLLILILDVLAIVDCVQSDKETGQKVLWACIIFFFPIIGLIAYYTIGKK